MSSVNQPMIDLLLTRRSALAATLVEPGPNATELELILRAATRVPDHGKLAPWRIQVFAGAERARLGDIFAGAFVSEAPQGAEAAADEGKVDFWRQRVQIAPLVAVVTLTPVEGKIPHFEQLMSGGAVCQNMIIAAHALGYAAQWLTEWPAYSPAVRKALGYGEGDTLLGFIHIGSRSEAPQERPRPTLQEVVTLHGI